MIKIEHGSIPSYTHFTDHFKKMVPSGTYVTPPNCYIGVEQFTVIELYDYLEGLCRDYAGPRTSYSSANLAGLFLLETLNQLGFQWV